MLIILIKDAAVGEKFFYVRCDAIYFTVNCPNQFISWYGSSSTKIFFRSGVDFFDSNNVYILIMHKANKVFTLRDGNSFDIDMADLEIWPQRHETSKNLEFEFPFCVNIKAVLRRRLLVFDGGPMRFATKFTLVTAQNTWKFDFIFGSEKFSRPTFATSTTSSLNMNLSVCWFI
jgi:hypothetical protein